MVNFAYGVYRKMTEVELAIYAIDRKCNLTLGYTETGISINSLTPYTFTE